MSVLRYVLTDPFFWAFLSAIGWAMGMLTVGSKTIGRFMLYGMTGSFLAQVPRIILPLPLVSHQPTFSPHWGVIVLSGVLCVVALFFYFPGLGLKIFTHPTHVEPLVTKGLYGVVRHPILFANVIWPLSLSMACGSWVGIGLVPVWFALVYLMSFIEEERMLETYGDAYRDYQRKVPRLIPFMRFL